MVVNSGKWTTRSAYQDRTVAMAQQYEKPYCESCENRMHSIINQLDVESVTKVSSTKGCHLYKKGQLIFQ